MQKIFLLLTTPLYIDKIRIPENNDWVIFCIVGGIFILVFTLLALNKEINVKEFLIQSFEDSGNRFLTWLLISFVACLMMAVFISQYIPIVPKAISDYKISNFSLNKVGFTFISLSAFYFAKTVLTYLYYSSIGQIKKWDKLTFVATKFYFVLSIVLMVANIIHYYFPIDKALALRYYLPAIAFIVIFKILFYFFNKNRTLPNQWYYKILYICTLQFIPVLVLWKVMFF